MRCDGCRESSPSSSSRSTIAHIVLSALRDDLLMRRHALRAARRATVPGNDIVQALILEAAAIIAVTMFLADLLLARPGPARAPA